MFRKIALALGAPLLLVTACAKEGTVDVKTGAAAVSALRAAPDAAADAGTVTLDVVMEMTLEGESFDIQATALVDAEAQQMSMSMDMGAMFEGLAESTGESLPEGLDGPMEIVVDGTTFYIRAPMFEMLTGSSGWLSMSPEDMGMSAEALGLDAGAYDYTQFLDTLRGVTGEPEVVGEEEVRGVPTTHYAASMDLAKAIEAAPADQREALEAAFEQLGDVGSGEIPVDVWIDADDLPRRMRVDMGGMFDGLGLGDEAGVVMTMEFFDYGEPVDIVVPSPDDVTPFIDVMGDLEGGLAS